MHLLEPKHSADTRLQKAEYHCVVLQQQITSFKKHAIHLPRNASWYFAELIHTSLAEDIRKGRAIRWTNNKKLSYSEQRGLELLLT